MIEDVDLKRSQVIMIVSANSGMIHMLLLLSASIRRRGYAKVPLNLTMKNLKVKFF